MKYTIVAGSQRQNAQSTKVAKYIKEVMYKEFQVEAYLLDMADRPLELYNPDQISPNWSAISQELQSSEGLVLITPEWNGMATAAIKNFFLYLNKQMADKPAMIISVSAGRGGRYPIQELRISSHKNSRIVYIPDHIIVDHVDNVLNDYPVNEGNANDSYLKQRINYSLKVLKEYSTALKLVRESKVLDYQTYPNGM